MLFYHFQALVTPFFKTFIIKGYAKNGRTAPSCPFHALMTSFPDMACINEEPTGYTNKDTMGAINETAIGAIIPAHNVPRTYSYSPISVETSRTMIGMKENVLDF